MCGSVQRCQTAASRAGAAWQPSSPAPGGEQALPGGGGTPRWRGSPQPGALRQLCPYRPAFILSLPFCRQLDNNQISCIEDGAFRALRDLEILWVDLALGWGGGGWLSACCGARGVRGLHIRPAHLRPEEWVAQRNLPPPLGRGDC